jgi:cytochrome c553
MMVNGQAPDWVLPPDHRQRWRWLSLGALMLWASTALAAAPLSSLETPSVAQGQLIAVGGGPGGAGAACFSCHGLQGQGDAGGAFPRLAGLDAHYLAKQMEDYASGARPDGVMAPISQRLTQADRESVALYYAGLPPQAPQVGAAAGADASSIQRGATLYAQGSAEHGIQACANCHGPGGRGLNRVYPSIAGQPLSYIETQLRRWQAGVRRNDIADLMGSVARRMTDEDIRAVSAYVAGLAP